MHILTNFTLLLSTLIPALSADTLDDRQTIITNLQSCSPAHRPKVAIIGSGIAGASAAYRLFERTRYWPGAPVITIFDQDSISGGRISSTGPYTRVYPRAESGAAFFLSDAICLRSAAAEVGLKASSYAFNFGKTTVIWDGHKLQASESFWYPETWQDSVKGWYKYGTAFRTLKRLVDTVQLRYSSFGYGAANMANLEAMLKSAELEKEVTMSAEDYFANYIERSSPFMTRVVIPVIRNRLSADLSEVSALSALLALGPGKPQKFVGGNWQLINRLIRLSEVGVQISSKVTRLRQGAEGGWLLQHTNDRALLPRLKEELFDYIIITSPVEELAIEVQASGVLTERNRKQSRTQTRAAREVTHFTSASLLSPSAFNQSSSANDAQIILTTGIGAGEYGLFSIVAPTQVRPQDTGGDDDSEFQWLFRIVSRKTLPNSEIARLFGHSLAVGESLRDIGVSWIDRKRWESGFKPFRVNDYTGDSKIADGLYVTSQGDGVVGSMEIACRMGSEAARKLARDIVGPIETYP